jgi:hypothetical protein
MSPTFSGPKNKRSKRELTVLLHPTFLPGLLFDREGRGDLSCRNVVLSLNGPHGVISQKIEFFTSTAVRTSDPSKEVVVA